jgi:hypothetical protein
MPAHALSLSIIRLDVGPKSDSMIVCSDVGSANIR